MPINSTHPSYSTDASDFTSDAYNGKVHKYVKKLQLQSQADYEAYISRSSYFNVIKRTTDALIGAMLRKPYLTNQENIQVSDGMSFDTMLSYALRDIFLTSRVGILVDFDESLGSPVMVPYNNNAITNWGDDFIVLAEDYYEVDPEDKYIKVIACQYRELTLIDGVYTVNIWRKTSNRQKEEWFIFDTVVPTVRGRALDYIPFVFINDRDTTCECRSPIMYNMAELNVGHFRTMADVEQCAHFLALPQPYMTKGFVDSEITSAYIGSPNIWVLEEGASVGYLEFSGQGFNSLMALANKKEEQMATLGAKFVAKAGVESAEALRLRTAGESATLVSMINALEQGIQMACRFYAQWLGMDPARITFEMNRDFTNVAASPQEIDTLARLLSSGQISQETFLQRLYEGEVVDDVKQEMERLGSEV